VNGANGKERYGLQWQSAAMKPLLAARTGSLALSKAVSSPRFATVFHDTQIKVPMRAQNGGSRLLALVRKAVL